VASSESCRLTARLSSNNSACALWRDSKLSNDEFAAKVKANTARWESVAQYNEVPDDLRNELLLRLAPVVLGLPAALVGL